MEEVIFLEREELAGLAQHLRRIATEFRALSRLIETAAYGPGPLPGVAQAAHDGVGLFVTQACERNSGEEISSLSLYQAYLNWAAKAGGDAMTHKRFSMALADLDVPKRRTNTGVRYLGIRLRHPDSQAEEGCRGN